MTINWVLETCDALCLISSKVARVLNVRAKRACFIIWTVGSLYWLYVDLHRQLYAQAIGCIISIGIHIYGYWHWGKKGIGKVRQ